MLCSLDKVGGGSSQEHPVLPQAGQLLQRWNIAVWSPSPLPALLLSSHPPRILMGQAENSATSSMTFEHIKRQQRKLARVPTPCLSPTAWEMRDHGSRPYFTGDLQQMSPLYGPGILICKMRQLDCPSLFPPCPSGVSKVRQVLVMRTD